MVMLLTYLVYIDWLDVDKVLLKKGASSNIIISCIEIQLRVDLEDKVSLVPGQAISELIRNDLQNNVGVTETLR